MFNDYVKKTIKTYHKNVQGLNQLRMWLQSNYMVYSKEKDKIEYYPKKWGIQEGKLS